jgi:hypothetical protein
MQKSFPTFQCMRTQMLEKTCINLILFYMGNVATLAVVNGDGSGGYGPTRSLSQMRRNERFPASFLRDPKNIAPLRGAQIYRQRRHVPTGRIVSSIPSPDICAALVVDCSSSAIFSDRDICAPVIAASIVPFTRRDGPPARGVDGSVAVSSFLLRPLPPLQFHRQCLC